MTFDGLRQVMLIKNEVISIEPENDTPAGRRAAHKIRLVNGSRGVVVRFRKKTAEDEPSWAKGQDQAHPPGGASSSSGRASGSGPDGPLPAGWASNKDGSGKEYYYRVNDPSVTQWEKPDEQSMDDETEYPEVRFTLCHVWHAPPSHQPVCCQRGRSASPTGGRSSSCPRPLAKSSFAAARSTAHKCRSRSHGR